jgi:hypothetical protein
MAKLLFACSLKQFTHIPNKNLNWTCSFLTPAEPAVT